MDFDRAKKLALASIGDVDWLDKAKTLIDEVLVLVKNGLENGVVRIDDGWEWYYGVSGVACGIGDDVFYFAGGCYETMEEYNDGRDDTRVLADVVSGIITLLYDYDEDEGWYLIYYLREHCAMAA